jgi:hypothetical protein
MVSMIEIGRGMDWTTAQNRGKEERRKRIFIECEMLVKG